MSTQMIQCNLIQFPRVSGEGRRFSKEFASQLAESIKAEGMYNAIVVRPNPEKPGHFLGVQGKHRHYAVANVLREQYIEAKIIDGMDETNVEMARLAENIFRREVPHAQRLKAIKRWWEIYRATYPDKVGKGTAGGMASKRKAEERREARDGDRGEDGATSDGGTADAGGNGQPAREPVANFGEAVAAATGQSVSTAKRYIRQAKLFDDEQLEIFDRMETSQADITKVAEIEDPVKRAEIIDLISYSMEAHQAIKEVMGDQDPALVIRKDGAGEETTDGQRAGTEAKPNLSFVSEGEEAESAEEPIGDSAGALDAAPGQGASSVDLSTDLAYIFDADQRETLYQMGVSHADRLTIASVSDASKRDQIIDLIAHDAELEARDAIKQVIGDAVPAADDGTGGAEAQGAARKEAADLSDDEWFDTYCGEKASNLGDPTLYKAGALLYRRLGEERHAHRKKVKKLLAAAEKAGMVEPYFLFVNRYISVSHPKDWYFCNQCRGTGVDDAGKECWKCRGGGYEVKVERYL